MIDNDPTPLTQRVRRTTRGILVAVALTLAAVIYLLTALGQRERETVAVSGTSHAGTGIAN